MVVEAEAQTTETRLGKGDGGLTFSGEKMRAMTFTYEAGDEEAEVFAVVMGSVAENFRGVTLHEIVDDTVFHDRDDHGAVDALYEVLTREGRLTDKQRAQLAEFSDALRDWREWED